MKATVVATIKETIPKQKGVTLQSGSTWAGHIAWGLYFHTWVADAKGVLQHVCIPANDERIEISSHANDTEVK